MNLVRFGAFQLDLRARELRRNGIKVRVPDQSIQILAMLLARPGEVVTREDLRARLWPNGTIVEFEHSVNAAMKRLRQALEDSPTAPQYIQTVPRVGYRFIGSMEPVAAHDGVPAGECDAADLEIEDRTLSHYRILDKLGEGGMGVVYRAQDTRLNRTVAIKMLSEDFSTDPQARERFAREAHAIASLDHPNICRLYDIGRRNLTDFLVLEYLDGETLAHRLNRGPLPPEQVVSFGVQMAGALSAAHRQNVIHRDLKPGNLMLTKSGVKLLDFGLAKLRPAGGKPEELSTAAAPLTGEGTILGTVQYMAPEQLKGEEADARTDIFALGTVLYEMTTGKVAFEGNTRADLVAAIMTKEPKPISAAVRSPVSFTLDHVVRKCLEKNQDQRWQTAYDVLVELEWIAAGGPQAGAGPSTSRTSRREILAWTLAGAASVAATGIAGLHPRERRPASAPLNLQIAIPPNMAFVGDYGNFAAISPDGRQLVWVAIQNGNQALWHRALDAPVIDRLPGTDNARMPFWSPDSRSIGFFSGGRLKRIDIGDGSVRDLCEAALGFGGAWNREGMIVFAPAYEKPLQRIAAAGGNPSPLIDLDHASGETAQLTPWFLPDGRHVLYESWRRGNNFVCLASTESNRGKPLIPGATLPSQTLGFVCFCVGNDLFAQRLDARTLQLAGEPRRLASNVDSVSASDAGVLAYHAGGSGAARFTWRQRDGMLPSTAGEPGEYLTSESPADESRVLSPDGTRVALERPAGGNPPTQDIWIRELTSGVTSRLTYKGGYSPIWSPDSKELVYTTNQGGQFRLWRKDLATGKEELVFTSDEEHFALDWSRDGSFLVVLCGSAYVRVPLTRDSKPESVFKTDFDKDKAKLSPDARWLAYMACESGRFEVYVAPFPRMSPIVQISKAGGGQPRWRGDGKELFYIALDGILMAVDLNTGVTLTAGPPQPLFQTRLRPAAICHGREYYAAPDGQRFLIPEPVDEAAEAITVVVGWTAELAEQRS